MRTLQHVVDIANYLLEQRTIRQEKNGVEWQASGYREGLAWTGWMSECEVREKKEICICQTCRLPSLYHPEANSRSPRLNWSRPVLFSFSIYSADIKTSFQIVCRQIGCRPDLLRRMQVIVLMGAEVLLSRSSLSLYFLHGVHFVLIPGRCPSCRG